MARSGLLYSAAAFSMSFIATLAGVGPAFGNTADRKKEAGRDGVNTNNHVGLWVTLDGQIRHKLLANGRYVEARGTREKAYEGRYLILGDHIAYKDDTGFAAEGDFVDGILYHAGMILYRRDN